MKTSLKMACAMLVLTVLHGPAAACDPKTPRCQKVDQLIDVLGYRDQVALMQMQCRGKAQKMRPEQLEKTRPAMMMGLIKNTGSWEQLNRAYGMYVDEACGGEELVALVMGAYRYAWNNRLPEASLEAGLVKAKAQGRSALSDDADFVRKQMNQVILPLLVRMELVAQDRYEARIKGIVSGEALEIAEGEMCADDARNELTTLTERVFPKTAQRATNTSKP